MLKTGALLGIAGAVVLIGCSLGHLWKIMPLGAILLIIGVIALVSTSYKSKS